MAADVNTGGFAQLVSFGPKSLNVIVPPAGAPSGPLITGLPGWLAVPFRFTRSDTGLPSCTSADAWVGTNGITGTANRSEEHTSELQSRENLVCRLLLEK